MQGFMPCARTEAGSTHAEQGDGRMDCTISEGRLGIILLNSLPYRLCIPYPDCSGQKGGFWIFLGFGIMA